MIAHRAGRAAAAVAAGAALLGAAAALFYARAGLTLTHYDARGHLIVARRILDNLTPGWEQIGGVWLPLPHLLNAVPIQNDWLYRTGAFATALSVCSFAAAAAAIAWIVVRLTDSLAAAFAATAVFALNPNVLYLQATPMTEPLLLALITVGVALLVRWTDDGGRRSRAGWALALACLTRYEAWPVTATALVLAAFIVFRRRQSLFDAVSGTARIALYPAVAILAFLVYSRIVMGVWFADDFFVPENPARGLPYEAFKQIVWGVRELSGPLLVAAAATGAAVLAVRGVRRRDTAAWLPLALFTTAAVPFMAFVAGHPYRIRYMVPLIAAEAICAGAAAGVLRRWAPAGAVVLLAIVGVELRPLNQQAPMVLEAQWDRPNIAAREAVSACLSSEYQGETVMASMGSLGHYMQNLAAHGFAIRDFLHEGNGHLWRMALERPRAYVGWILIEEKAEGGDMLAQRARANPHFLDGFTRVCEAAGLALYRRQPLPQTN